VIVLDHAVAKEKVETSHLQIIQIALSSIGHTHPYAHRHRPSMLLGPPPISSAPAVAIQSR
jgi:hypothetical protein